MILSVYLILDFQDNPSHGELQTRPMCCPEPDDVPFIFECVRMLSTYRIKLLFSGMLCYLIGARRRADLTDRRNGEQLADNRADHPDFTVCNNIIRCVYRAELILGR